VHLAEILMMSVHMAAVTGELPMMPSGKTFGPS
jgi:hypothetical protein